MLQLDEIEESDNGTSDEDSEEDDTPDDIPDQLQSDEENFAPIESTNEVNVLESPPTTSTDPVFEQEQEAAPKKRRGRPPKNAVQA